MASYAVVREGVVINCILADGLETAQAVTGLECVEFSLDPIEKYNNDRITIGWTWDGSEFAPPSTNDE